ncbi:MAG TPA: DUF955 domain-containing protein [Phycisphaerae bacterium]|nr:DUF955 domain-containing protein [Phycisphaerae bacterium]
MQTNILLSQKTVASVDARVGKILKDLGNPPPPISLEQTRTLLKLDLAYYSTADATWLAEKLHKLKVAGKQVLSTPKTIFEATKTLGLKGLLFFDRRRILLDSSIAEPKLRWNEAHEITHSILPWHEDIAHGDLETTLSPACHELIEAEANYGAGRLLFCGSPFIETVRSSPLTVSAVMEIRNRYKNTITTTLWRVIEATHLHAFGFISTHPMDLTGDIDVDIRYFIRSHTFAEHFSTTQPFAIYKEICKQCHRGRGPVGDGAVSILDDRGDAHSFVFETFWNHHDALTIAYRS